MRRVAYVAAENNQAVIRLDKEIWTSTLWVWRISIRSWRGMFEVSGSR